MPLKCVRRADCRLCGSTALELVISLRPTPPANAFVPAALVGHSQACFPLEVYFCNQCSHVQLLDVVDPQELFGNYVYVSGTSPSFVKHFEDYASQILRIYQPASGALVVDIGSNDGTLLKCFKRRGLRVLGIDPARAIAEAATAHGIETWAEFFQPEVASRIVAELGTAKLLTANNVFAHADNLGLMAESVRILLAQDGVFTFEVSYLADVYNGTLFDTIYHEHLSYHSVRPLIGFFVKYGLELIRVDRVSSHGGSIRCHVQHRSGPHSRHASVIQLSELEESLGLDNADTLHKFGAKIDLVRDALVGLLQQLKSEGKRIAGFGAPAKATTLMYHFGLGPDQIEFIVDDSPLKQGLFTPGMHIPVLPSTELAVRQPDYTVILAWNFADAIISQNQQYLNAGGHFIVPLPDIKVI